MSEFKLYARWTDDCQGKKDYDGPIISISTRYWPRGGGFHILKGGNWEQSNDQTIKPSAHCSLVINYGICEDGDGGSDTVTLVGDSFEGESLEEVQAKVETYAQSLMDKVVETLQRELGRQP